MPVVTFLPARVPVHTRACAWMQAAAILNQILNMLGPALELAMRAAEGILLVELLLFYWG